jgi:acyl-coenzyme A synthetase/AMP-(fatty) acid ligase
VEVESVLLQHPEVAGVGVAAVPDDVRGDEVMACVVPRVMPSDAARASFARDVMDFCLARLAYFKAPGYLAFCDRLPLTPTEKIQRGELKNLALRSLRDGGCIDLRAFKKRGGAA